MAEQGAVVTIGIQELIGLMAAEVARKVGDELRIKEIEPLHDRIAELERRVDTKTAQFGGAFEAIWKVGIVIVALVEIWHNLGLKDLFGK